MTGILELLCQPETWQGFLDDKIANHYLGKKEREMLTAYVKEQRYLPTAQKLADRNYCLSAPTRRTINKSGTAKKRVVYTFPDDENLFLKGLAHLLYRYDDKLSPRCYSFRQSRSARNAIFDILAQPNRDDLYCFKADISNYFNAIPEDRLVEVLEEVITDDPDLLWFFRKLLLANVATLPDATLVEEHRGAMAGTPISPFFANVYLLAMDRFFESHGVAYFRYSDDILIFSSSEEDLEVQRNYFYEYISQAGLTINPKKVSVSTPGEAWEFLGFSYFQGEVDISSVTKDKLKGKIRRKAHALYRWKTKKGADFERAARALVRTFNKKFYNEQNEDLFTWSRWFFPIITTDRSLQELDQYLVQYVRYLSSGRHYKGNYRITYDQVKALGFRSLRHEYYLSRSKDSWESDLREDSSDGNNSIDQI